MTSMKTPPAAEAVVHFEVRRFGAFLSTRSTGAKIREELEAAVRSDRSTELVEIEFSGVEAVTISFADEFIGRLMSARAAGDIGEAAVMVAGLNDELEEALSICLERRNAMIVASDPDGLRLLGGDVLERRTFDAAIMRGTLRASDLAADLGITPQNANNRLKRLTLFGALRRRKEAPQSGGREFVYLAPKSRAQSHAIAESSAGTAWPRRQPTSRAVTKGRKAPGSAVRSSTGRHSN